MARPETQKNLQADIPQSLHDALIAWISDHRDVKIRQCVQAMVELWLGLPDRIQAELLIAKPETSVWAGAFGRRSCAANLHGFDPPACWWDTLPPAGRTPKTPPACLAPILSYVAFVYTWTLDILSPA